jgi:hypothetical protein
MGRFKIEIEVDALNYASAGSRAQDMAFSMNHFRSRVVGITEVQPLADPAPAVRKANPWLDELAEATLPTTQFGHTDLSDVTWRQLATAPKSGGRHAFLKWTLARHRSFEARLVPAVLNRVTLCVQTIEGRTKLRHDDRFAVAERAA